MGAPWLTDFPNEVKVDCLSQREGYVNDPKDGGPAYKDIPFEHVLALQAERKAGHLSPAQSALLIRISEGLPAQLAECLAALRAKRDDDTITDAEYEELTRLRDQAGELHAGRLAALVELPEIRGVSLPFLMDQLGIHFPDNA